MHRLVKGAMAASLAALFASATVMPVEAQSWHGGWHGGGWGGGWRGGGWGGGGWGGGWGPAVVGGLAAGAIVGSLASPYYYYGYGGYGGYGRYGGCTVPLYDQWGNYIGNQLVAC
jgi:hypothetical protein